MTRISRTLASATFLMVPALAFGQDEEERTVKYKERTEIDF